MSKWSKAKLNLANMSCDGCQFGYCPSDCDLRGCSFGETVGIALEALNIAERLEKANVTDVDVYENCAPCPNAEICKERDEVCSGASCWIDGYNTAIADVRGDSSATRKALEPKEGDEV